MADFARSPQYLPHDRAVVETALYLYDIGLSIGPQPYEPRPQLRSFPWKRLQYIRIPREHPLYGLHQLFAGRCNIGVIRGTASRNLFTLSYSSDRSLNEQLEALQAQKLARWATRQLTGEGGEIWFLCSEGGITDRYYQKPFEILGTGYVLCPPFHSGSDNPVQWLVREGEEPPTVTCSQMESLFYENGERIRSLTGEPVTLTLPSAVSQRHQSLQEIRLQRAEALLAFAQSHQWPGKAGTTERDIFLALIQRMKADSNTVNGVFRASEREIAELARRGRKAVHRALEGLQKQKLILYAGPDDKSRANRYRFPDAVIREGITQHKKLSDSIGTSLSLIFNGVDSTCSLLTPIASSPYSPLGDTLEPTALGRNALTVYDILVLAGSPLVMPSIAVKSGLSLNKVRTAIQKLIRFGMVEHKGPRVGYVALPKTIQEVAAIAKVAGTEGKSTRRKAKHHEERCIHTARGILLARQERDEANLPLELQPPRDWKCSHCGDQVSTRYGLLPEICPHCEQTKPTWKRLPRPKKRSMPRV